MGWTRGRDIALDGSRPGKPVDDAYVASSTGELRDEYLNEQCLTGPAGAQRTVERWRRQYNRRWPHRRRGQQTPGEYAAPFTPGPDVVV
jgi:transposase InsO family protein